MRIIKSDFKHGLVKVQVEDADDLWALDTIIDPGDGLRASTERKLKLGGSEEKARVIKKRVTLTIRAEKLDYSGESLRAIGPITDGPDDMPRGSSHSFTLTPGEQVTIKKEQWLRYQRAKLEEATKKRRAVIIVLFDREQALFLRLTGRSVEELLKLKGDVAKKGLDEQKHGSFYEDIAKQLAELDRRYGASSLILASPAFWQEYLKARLPPELKKKAAFTSISSVDRTAVKELVRRPELKGALADARATRELGYVEEIMTALSHEKLAYGEADVIAAVAEGNLKALFITESLIRKQRNEERFAETERVLRNAEGMDAAVHVLATDEASGKLDGLGGVAAIKRW